MTQEQKWQPRREGGWVARIGALKLLVLPGETWVRYLILRPEENDDPPSEVLLRSGTKEDIGAAMQAAETDAGKLEAHFAALHRAA
ncbi:conserved protein of unknown function [Rhodovastum atsumiense]|uniref:Uncharacterized protein n=1 Tax=Rhodovastum atsumiense TaxID=504468 RepID=A0A5M6ILQ7_9PROT|nr:hypothetical protein [Rhodovastum atsumiense]KAA5609206.1 hypothetical protein F1189_25255 [Rhodovastum atsumiense]CAH2603966.1 conserved protein of unknown function [Rhodovastum atsumiense]